MMRRCSSLSYGITRRRVNARMGSSTGLRSGKNETNQSGEMISTEVLCSRAHVLKRAQHRVECRRSSSQRPYQQFNPHLIPGLAQYQHGWQMAQFFLLSFFIRYFLALLLLARKPVAAMPTNSFAAAAASSSLAATFVS